MSVIYKGGRSRSSIWTVLFFVLIMGLVGTGIYYAGGMVYAMMTGKGSAAAEVQSVQNASSAQAQTPASESDKYAALYGEAKYLIHVHKRSYSLELFERGQAAPLRSYGIAVGKNTGDKERPGDNRTPVSWGNAVNVHGKYNGAKFGAASEAVPFRVEEIIDSSSWSHDFHDGKGVIPHAYGPWFISLDTGWDGIGIHGTHDPSSIGQMISEGCIRLRNEDVAELKAIITSDKAGIGTGVVITED